MRAPQHKTMRKYGFNMTPMIDVVFLLIIFFLVTSHLAKQETNLELELPVAKSADDDLDTQTPRITINIKPDGSMWMAGRPISRERLVERLEAAKADKGNGIEVRIRASRSVPYSNVEPIMLACIQSGVWNVAYAVYREEQ